MYFLRWALVVFLLLVSLATWVPSIRIAGVSPDLLLGVVFALALRRGGGWGVWSGFLLGLLIGVEQPLNLGVDSMALALAGIVIERGSSSLDRRNPLVLVLLLFAAALAAESVRVVWMAGRDLGTVPLLWLRWALPGALYTTLALPLLVWMAGRVLGRKDWLTGAA